MNENHEAVDVRDTAEWFELQFGRSLIATGEVRSRAAEIHANFLFQSVDGYRAFKSPTMPFVFCFVVVSK